MTHGLSSFIEKAPPLLRWVLALPVAVVALSIAQVVATIVVRIFFEINKLLAFSMVPGEVNYFLVNIAASMAFLSAFHFIVPKHKLTATLILAITYAVLSGALFVLLVADGKFEGWKSINETSGIITGCAVGWFMLKESRSTSD